MLTPRNACYQFAALFLIWGFPVYSWAASECHEKAELRSLKYCVHTSEGSQNPNLVYYFHRALGSETTWKHTEARLRQGGLIRDEQMPTVVTISFGGIWLLAEKNESRRSGLLELFVDQVMPTIETGLSGSRGARLLAGESMGGANVVQLALKHPELFDRIAAMNPGVLAHSPHSGIRKTLDYIQRTHADPFKVFYVEWMVRSFFPDEESWATGDSLELSRTAFGPDTPPLLISAARSDEYGFFAASQQLAETALQNGARRVTWRPVDGNHGSFDLVALADFLQEHDLPPKQ